MAKPFEVCTHVTLISAFRVGVLSSVIQACKPDAKIAQLCEQGDRLVQECVMQRLCLARIWTADPVVSLKACVLYLQSSKQGIQGEKH